MQTVLNLRLGEVLFPANLLLQFVQTADMPGAFPNLQWAISVLQRENKEKWQQGIKYKLILMPLLRREAANKIIGRLVTTSEFFGFQRCESRIGKINWVPILSLLCENARATTGKNANSSNSNCNNKYDRNCLKKILICKVRAFQNSYPRDFWRLFLAEWQNILFSRI